MTKGRRLSAAALGIILSIFLAMSGDMTVQADGIPNLQNTRGGVATLLVHDASGTTRSDDATAVIMSLDSLGDDAKAQPSTLVMANVKSVLNVRAEADSDAKKVGKLYKDCGGVILDRKDGWTKLQSGNVVGWAKDEYLLFEEEAAELADNVGKTIATVDAETLRVRQEPGTEGQILGLLPKGEIIEVVKNDEETGWVCVDYDGVDGYVSAEFVRLDFLIDTGETMEEIKAREEAEKEAKRHKNYGQYTTDADTALLLAALIHCEARGEPYEGQLAVGAVVMNRVRSGAYPDSIHGVIYASGQFTPAMSGRLNQVYESGKIQESCIQAAQEALSGVSNVGDMTHFRRNNGTRSGLVIGHHVFY